MAVLRWEPSPPLSLTGRHIQGGIKKSRLSTNRFIENDTQERAIFTMAEQYKFVYGLLKGASFNDLE